MYVVILALHSVIRWVVVGLGVVAVVRALRGQSGRKAWTSTDGRVGFSLTIALDLQLLLGLVLFIFLSSVTTVAVRDLSLAMSSRVARFWTIEHPVLMIGAVVLAHVARVRIRREAESRLRHQAAALFFGLALLLVLAGIPWPFLPYGRPFLPLR